MKQYVYEIFEVTDAGVKKGYNNGDIRIISEWYGFYSDLDLFDEKNWDIIHCGRRHYLFQIEADIKKQREEAIQEMKEKLAKKRKFITRNLQKDT